MNKLGREEQSLFFDDGNSELAQRERIDNKRKAVEMLEKSNSFYLMVGDDSSVKGLMSFSNNDRPAFVMCLLDSLDSITKPRGGV